MRLAGVLSVVNKNFSYNDIEALVSIVRDETNTSIVLEYMKDSTPVSHTLFLQNANVILSENACIVGQYHSKTYRIPTAKAESLIKQFQAGHGWAPTTFPSLGLFSQPYSGMCATSYAWARQVITNVVGKHKNKNELLPANLIAFMKLAPFTQALSRNKNN